MQRLYITFLLLICGVFSLLSMQAVNAAEPTANCYPSGPGQVNSSNPLYAAKFGAWVNMFAKTSGDNGVNCLSYRTPIDSYPTAFLTEQTSEAVSGSLMDRIVYGEGTPNEYTLNIGASSSASASIASGSVSSRVRKYNYTGYTSTSPEWIDLVKIENLNAALTDVNYIPVTFCSELVSEFDTNGVDSSLFAYGDFHTVGPNGFDHKAADKLIMAGGQRIVHASTGKVCRTGEIKMTGQYVYFSLKLTAYTLGNYGHDPVDIGNGYTNNVPVYDGSITATFDMGALPAGATCQSASGVFPGCDRVCNAPELSSIAAPMQTDYSDAIFSLTRAHHQADSCEPSACGVNWHSSYERTADFLLSAESHTVAVKDESGAETLFRENNPGVWEPVEEYSVNTFAELLDSSQTLIGYQHTDASGTKDTYDLNGVLREIERPTGEILDVTYDTSERLSAVTEMVSGESLSFTYNAHDQLALVTAPSDTISYTYDANNNLTSAVNALGTTTYAYDDPANINALTLISHSSGTSTVVSNTSSFQDIINAMYKILIPANVSPNPNGYTTGLPNRVVDGDYLKIVTLPHPKKGAAYFARHNDPNLVATAQFSHIGLDDQYNKPQLSCDFPIGGIKQYTVNPNESDLNSPNRLRDPSQIRPYGIYDLFETFAHELWHLSKGTPIDLPLWPNSPAPSEYQYLLTPPFMVTAANEATETDAFMKGRELLIKHQDEIRDTFCKKTCVLGICF